MTPARPGSPCDPSVPDALERMIETRVALRAEADAVRWRFRLVAIEALLLAALVFCAGLALGQAPLAVLKAALLVGTGCFASGMMLVALSAASARLLARIRRGRRRR